MARYIEASCRRCRRAGEKLFLKGERCLGPKCAFTRRSYPPGVRGPKRVSGRRGDYALQLNEKQKTKDIYGILERQFRNYYRKASLTNDTGLSFLIFLETRLDNILKKANIAPSVKNARQLVTHEHILVNGKKVKSPNISIHIGDKIQLAQESKFQNDLKTEVPKWLKVDEQKKIVEVVGLPTRDDISRDINEEMIVELYSR